MMILQSVSSMSREAFKEMRDQENWATFLFVAWYGSTTAELGRLAKLKENVEVKEDESKNLPNLTLT